MALLEVQRKKITNSLIYLSKSVNIRPRKNTRNNTHFCILLPVLRYSVAWVDIRLFSRILTCAQFFSILKKAQNDALQIVFFDFGLKGHASKLQYLKRTYFQKTLKGKKQKRKIRKKFQNCTNLYVFIWCPWLIYIRPFGILTFQKSTATLTIVRCTVLLYLIFLS